MSTLQYTMTFMVLLWMTDHVHSYTCKDFDYTYFHNEMNKVKAMCDPNQHCHFVDVNGWMNAPCQVTSTDFECRQLSHGVLTKRKPSHGTHLKLSRLGVRAVYPPNDMGFYDFFVIITLNKQDLAANLTTGVIIELESTDESNCMYKPTDQSKSLCHFINTTQASPISYHSISPNHNNTSDDGLVLIDHNQEVVLSHACIAPEIYPGSFLIRVTSYPSLDTTEYHVMWASFYDDSEEADGVWVQPVIALTTRPGNKIYAVIQEHKIKFKDLKIFLDLRNNTASVQKAKLGPQESSYTFEPVPIGFYQVKVTVEGIHCFKATSHCPSYTSTWIHIDTALNIQGVTDTQMGKEVEDKKTGVLPLEVVIFLSVILVGAAIMVLLISTRLIFRKRRAETREHYVMVVNLEQGRLKERTVDYFSRCIPEFKELNPSCYIQCVNISDLKIDEIYNTETTKQQTFFILRKLKKLNKMFKTTEKTGSYKMATFDSYFLDNMFLRSNVDKTIVFVGFEGRMTYFMNELDHSEVGQGRANCVQHNYHDTSTIHERLPTFSDGVSNIDNEIRDINNLSDILQKVFKVHANSICSIQFAKDDISEICSGGSSSSPIIEMDDDLNSLNRQGESNNDEYSCYNKKPKKTESIFSKINQSNIFKLRGIQYKTRDDNGKDETGNTIKHLKSFCLPSEISNFLSWLTPGKRYRGKKRFNVELDSRVEESEKLQSAKTKLTLQSMEQIEKIEKWRAAMTSYAGSCITITDGTSSLKSERLSGILVEDNAPSQANSIRDPETCSKDYNRHDAHKQFHNIPQNHNNDRETKILLENVDSHDFQRKSKNANDSRYYRIAFKDDKHVPTTNNDNIGIGDSGFHDSEENYNLGIRPPRTLDEIDAMELEGFGSQDLNKLTVNGGKGEFGLTNHWKCRENV